MAQDIEDTEAEQLAAEVAEVTGTANERKSSAGRGKPKSMQEWLETEIWPRIPEEERGKRLTKEEVEDILGFGPEGV
jgi:antitoxin VapB